MSSPESEQVLALLKELAGLKELDGETRAGGSEAERDAHLSRLKRHGEITEEIKALAELKKKARNG